MRLLAACLAAALLAGCKSDPKITGVRIVAESWGGRAVDRLVFTLTVHEEPMQMSIQRPEQPASPLASPQDLVVYLPDRFVGKSAACQVDAKLGDEVVARGVPRAVTIEFHRVVLCSNILEPVVRDDGGALPDSGPFVFPDAGLTPDTGPAPDGFVPPDVALSPDLSPGQDLPPGADLRAPPPPDGAPPVDIGAPPPDTALPPDTGAPPPDAPLPPDTAPVVTGCAGNAARTAFVDPVKFPNIASCGAVVTYNTALTAGSGACAAGWHWCSAEEISPLPAGNHPGTVGGATCSWVNGTQAACGDKRFSYPAAGCTGAPMVKNQSVGGPPSGSLPCINTDLNCMESWKLAVSFDRWESNSVTRMGGGCLEHMDIKCTSMTGGVSCWTSCCKN